MRILKNIRPGKLRGLNRAQIESALENLFQCPVRYYDGEIYAYCVSQYRKTSHLMNDMRQISNVGSVSVVSDRVGVAVRIVLNQRARDIINEVIPETEEIQIL